jgi:translation initiation factor IF-3
VYPDRKTGRVRQGQLKKFTGKWDPRSDPHPATSTTQHSGCAGSACCATSPASQGAGWSFDGGHSRVRHRRVRVQVSSPRGRKFPDEAGDHIAAHEVRINDRIRAREVFLVGADGEQLGVRPLPEALARSREQELDLVEVAPNANPPVCRIMDYGRYVYEQEQRRRQSKRKATNVVIKEMKFRPKIDEHDYTTKMKHVVRFLGEVNKVKLTIMFRGREMAHPELGMKILRRVADDVADFAVVESDPRQDGRNMTMVLHPTRKDGKKPSGRTEPEEPAETGAA